MLLDRQELKSSRNERSKISVSYDVLSSLQREYSRPQGMEKSVESAKAPSRDDDGPSSLRPAPSLLNPVLLKGARCGTVHSQANT